MQSLVRATAVAPIRLALPATNARRSAVARAESPSKPKFSSEEMYEATEKVVADIKTKWDKTEEKPAAVALLITGVVAVYVLNGVVNAVHSVPIISGVFELVGIFVSSWFVYRYLVFGPDREELKANINDFFKKVAGKSQL
eukprot:TRINITY_DN4683_c1_g1_i2.p3 TRINITY_DN4683_c1_g1~~TRINITY_DN4683_c1_g1_i2.p3  ORF type:complete len:141 (+),score=16.03 TRINITY_DN4683_c1_g1_i2:185-607(+)